MDKSYKVVTVETLKTGTGKKGAWTLRKVTLEGTDIEPSGFDAVTPGDMVTIEEKQNGEYLNHNYKKVKAPVGQPTSVPGGDAKTIALLLLICDQMGLNEKALEIMEK